MTADEKQRELLKFRDLNQATLDYHIELYARNPDKRHNPTDHYKFITEQIEEHYQKGRLTILRQWLRYFTERFQEKGLEYSRYNIQWLL